MIAARRSNLDYLWNSVVLPRVGNAAHRADAYSWGGSFSPTDINQGSDCSGAVSAELSALMRGPTMIWNRQFWTGTFAGVTPGTTGPFADLTDTLSLRALASPDRADPGAAMLIAVLQLPDAEQAHMICRVPPPEGCADIRTGGVDIEMGGQSDNYHTSRTDPTCASVMDTREFNQWFVWSGPITEDLLTAPSQLDLISAQFL